MKLVEVANDEMLTEMVKAENNTGLLTEDVVKIIKAAQNESEWSEPMTGDQLIEYLKGLVNR